MNFGRQSRGSIVSSVICGNRKSGGRRARRARLPGPPRSSSQYQRPKIRKFVSQISMPETISSRPLRDVVVQQEVGERDERVDVGRADERDQAERDAPPARVLVLELVGRREEQADQQQRPRAPGRARTGPIGERVGQRELQARSRPRIVSCAGQNGSGGRRRVGRCRCACGGGGASAATGRA